MKAESFDLTAKELSFITDKEFLKTKNAIIERVVVLFAGLEKSLREHFHSGEITIPLSFIPKPGKISKGDKYKGLPYVVMDFPAVLTQVNIFAFRSLFWWGNYFSNQFILKGKYFEEYRSGLIKGWELMSKENVYIDLSSDPWNHDISMQSIITIRSLSNDKYIELINNRPFIKFIWCLPLKKSVDFSAFTYNNLQLIAKLLMSGQV